MNIKKVYNFTKKKIFPLNRSLTGEGNRKTLRLIKKLVPDLKIKSIPSGKKVFDWKIPPEWDIKYAHIKDKFDNKIINFKENNLHLVGYSIPVNKILNKSQLLKKLYSLPKQPNAIPYITSFYKKDWGFCASYKQVNQIKKKYKNNDKFKVEIKSSFKEKGVLNYGEIFIKGKTKKEILISTYICHPSMANNELSGPMVAMCLINYFKKFKNEKSIRFIFIPETIGSIAYIKQNYDHLKKYVCGGYNLSCIGDNRAHSCMLSKFENSASDEALLETYKQLKIEKKVHSFLKRGSDERQYNSPGVDLPIASIFRTRYGDYPEYHTSLDNFDLVSVKGISGGFNIAKYAIINLQNKIIPSAKIYCEPQLGKRGLYPSISDKKLDMFSRNIVNILMYSNGRDSLEKISKIIKLNYNECLKLYKILVKNKLIN